MPQKAKAAAGDDPAAGSRTSEAHRHSKTSGDRTLAQADANGNSLAASGDLDLTRRAARDYIARGWSPIEIEHRRKAPLHRKNWQKKPVTSDTVDKRIVGSYSNLGVLLGEPSDGLVDIDLDWPEARRLAPHILPQTPEQFGRRSSPNSHRLYTSRGADTKQFSLPGPNQGGDRNMIVELRSTGGQTVFPPSVHPTGEKIEWTAGAGNKPPEVDPSDLTRRCGLLAVASLVLRHWVVGNRNRLALAVSGGLLDCDWSVEQVKGLIKIVADEANDREERLGIVDKTEAKRGAGRKYVGLPTLGRYLGIDANTLREWLGSRALCIPADRIVSLAPVELARHFIEKHGDVKHWRRDFYTWTGSCWQLASDDDLRSLLYLWLEDKLVLIDKDLVPYNPTSRKISDIIDALRGIEQLKDSFEAPCWLEGTGPDPREMVVFRNGVLNLRTMELMSPDRRLFVINIVNCDYAQDAKAPTWDRFMQEVFPNNHLEDDDCIGTMEELIGLWMVPDTRFQKALLAVGVSGSGKGTIMRTVKELIGPANYCGTSIDAFAGDFGLEPTVGKLLTVIGDARQDGRINLHVLVERILMVVGEDDVMVNRKHKKHWLGKLPTRLAVVSNELPKLIDASGTVVKRLIAIRFDQVFRGTEKEDIALSDKLAAELPGIANRAIAGWHRLHQRGRFKQPDSGKPMLAQLDLSAHPVRTFVADKCIVDPDGRIVCKELYDTYREWCLENGNTPLANNTFGNKLLDAFPKVRRVRVWDNERQKQVWWYVGIRLDEASPYTDYRPAGDGEPAY